MSESTITRLLKRIFSAQSLGIIIAVFALIISIRQCGHEFGGDLDVNCNTIRVYNNETRNIVIITDIKRINAYDLCPNFINTDKYSIRDFTLKHNVESNGIKPIPTDFYSISSISNTNDIYKYSENILPPHQTTEPPFTGFELTDNKAFCRIHSSATWDGAEEPFEFTVNAYIHYLTKDSNESFEAWQNRSRQYIVNNTSLSNYDAVYITTDNYQREFNLSIYQAPPLTTELKELSNSNADIEDSLKNTDKTPTVKLDSLISVTNKQYSFKYKHLSKENRKNLFLVYVAKNGNIKSIGHVGYHDIIYPIGDVTITTNKEYYISDFLGIASEDSFLSQYIAINGNNFKNNHPTQYIGISFRTKKNSWHSGIINPNSTVSWKLDANDYIEDVHYFIIKDEWVNSVTTPNERIQYKQDPTFLDNFMIYSGVLMIILFFVMPIISYKYLTYTETLFIAPDIPYNRKRIGVAINTIGIYKPSPWYYILYILSIIFIIFVILWMLIMIYEIAMLIILN